MIRIRNIIKLGNEFVVDPTWSPDFYDIMTTWYSERNKNALIDFKVCCNFCRKGADYDIFVGNCQNQFLDSYFHTVCKNHFRFIKCEKKGHKCDFCNKFAEYYVRAGDHGVQKYDNDEEDRYGFPRKHYVCKDHIRIIEYDNRLASDWYRTYMR